MNLSKIIFTFLFLVISCSQKKEKVDKPQTLVKELNILPGNYTADVEATKLTWVGRKISSGHDGTIDLNDYKEDTIKNSIIEQGLDETKFTKYFDNTLGSMKRPKCPNYEETTHETDTVIDDDPSSWDADDEFSSGGSSEVTKPSDKLWCKYYLSKGYFVGFPKDGTFHKLYEHLNNDLVKYIIIKIEIFAKSWILKNKSTIFTTMNWQYSKFSIVPRNFFLNQFRFRTTANLTFF